jgi:putative ABC transport system permease protein
MQRLWQDTKYAARTLRQHPGFTAIAVLTLALAIGATSSIFSVVNSVLLKALPYKDPEHLVLLWGTDLTGNQRDQISYTDLADWRTRTKSFTNVVAYNGMSTPILSGSNEPEPVAAMQVSDGYFELMQTPPLLGRALVSEDQQPGKDQVVVLSHGLWQRRFGQDTKIIGQTISLDSRPYTVVGVMPANFHSLPSSLVHPSDVYLPLAAEYDDTQRSFTWLRGIARLKPNVTLAQAQAELDVIARTQALEHADTNAGRGVRVVRLQADLVRDLRAALLILQGAVLLVVLIACVNLANLLLARLTARRKEIAIRAALGAGRLRLLRQLLVESLLLSLTGGACGLLLTVWGVKVLQGIGAKVLPELSGIELDVRVLAFTGGLSLLTAIIFSLAPAMNVSVDNLGESLKEGGRGSGSSVGRRGVRQFLVVSEIALSVVLLVCAGLLIRTFLNLRSMNPGFDPHHTLTMNIALPEAKYSTDPKQIAFFRDVISRVQRLPGVEYAAITSILPESGNAAHTWVQPEGRTYGPNEKPFPDVFRVSSDYFRTLSVPLLQGRLFSDADDADHPLVALINETMAQKLWPGEDPVGKRMARGDTMLTIVGVVGDVYQYGLDSQKTMQLYLPFAQQPQRIMTMTVRGSSDPLRLVSAIRDNVRAVDQDQPVFRIATMDQILADSMARQRFSMILLAVFAAGALLLAAVGIYGVMSYVVAGRTREIGLRIALGADPRRVLRLVLGEGLTLAVIGSGIGAVAAFLATRLLTSLLYGVSSSDPLTFVAVAVLLAAVALLACYVPARRAAKVDPLVALRAE